MSRVSPPQAFTSSYAPRIRGYANALLTPIVQPPTVVPPIRTTKRGTTAINYAEDGYGSEFDDDPDAASRRLTGLRTRRDDSSVAFGIDRAGAAQDRQTQYGKELHAPVDMQGIWREWMSKSGQPPRTEKQAQLQCLLPLTLIPIKVDIDIPSFRPEAPLPTPPALTLGGVRIDENLPAYRQQEMTPGFRLKDVFMWNLWESMCTPDQFAKVFVDEMDFDPNRKTWLVQEISRQIREQLEQHASTALHPLFQIEEDKIALQPRIGQAQDAGVNGDSASTPAPKSNAVSSAPVVTAVAARRSPSSPPDTYRCILHLSINLQSQLYTDRIEWSLLHPPGYAETFARLTCADLGLPPEWATSIAHAIYDSVLRLKKEACDSQGQTLVFPGADGATATLTGAPLDNDAANEVTGAGWRYEPESLAAEWAPKVETLSKEEIERREGDRERRLRRARRETARLGADTADAGARRSGLGVGLGDTYNAYGGRRSAAAPAAADDDDGERVYGRGERSKKKRRYRSLSPSGRDTPDSGGVFGPGGGAALNVAALGELERSRWRCDWCKVWGAAVWGTRDGPDGPNSLCHNCGYILDRDKRLPPWSEGMFEGDTPQGVPARR